jgi:hypothetical protein
MGYIGREILAIQKRAAVIVVVVEGAVGSHESSPRVVGRGVKGGGEKERGQRVSTVT